MASTITIYEHYTQPAIKAGLTTDNADAFLLNGRPLVIYSGAVHYFRVPRAYWRDRLRKLKAAGLNTVETYVPWNLHEPQLGCFDFGAGGSDFEDFLHVAEFLRIAQEEELLAIIRPGPYICSEWDFGGLPAWLLRDARVQMRRGEPHFLEHVGRYFEALFDALGELQFTKGGPIIAFQVENEYGNVQVADEPIDQAYLQRLAEMLRERGVVELLFTSDTPSNGSAGAVPGILSTANFQRDAVKELTTLRGLQPDKPLMVMEFWSGWFDHWGEPHHTLTAQQFAAELEDILAFPASVNFYMFHGGSTWGFLNGANIMEADGGHVAFDTSSYDYDAPLTEAGDYTEKYHALKCLIAKHSGLPMALPAPPAESTKVQHASIPVEKMMPLSKYLEMLQHRIGVECAHSERLQPMEFFGQSHGYIVYSKTMTLHAGATLRLADRVKDTILVLLNGRLVNKPFARRADLEGFGYWKLENSSIVLTEVAVVDARLDLVVENFGRVNYGKLHEFDQRRGLTGSVYIDDEEVRHWHVLNLPFSMRAYNELNALVDYDEDGTPVPAWEDVDEAYVGPALYRFTLHVEKDARHGQLVDSFVDMSAWNKGIVIVNGFVLSRYFRLGPQQTCYLPGPLLRDGANDVIVFEHFERAQSLAFSAKPIFATLK